MNIGFITPNIHSGSAKLIWPPMAELARQQGHRLFLFPGGRLGHSDASEHNRNRLYDFVQSSQLDVCISWTSALGGIVSSEGVKIFHQRFNGLPLVAIGDQLPGAPTIFIDAYRGMRMLLEHLYTVHGARRFAFIRGPEEHVPAADRFRAFTDFTNSQHLDAAEQWVSPCLGWGQGADAVRVILDVDKRLPGRDFDALVASSDLQLLDALQGLSDRGYSAPQDFFAGGFNDSPESRLINPSFTTVSMPFGQAGEQAFFRAVGSQAGSTSLSPRLIIRKSCGCFTHPRDLRPQPAVEAIAIDEPRFEKILAQDILNQIQGGSEELNAWVQPLVQSIIQTLTNQNVRAFFDTLENILSRVITLGYSMYVWQDALTAAHTRCRLGVGQTALGSLELMIERGRLLISDAMERQSVIQAWDSSEFFRRMQGFEQLLLGLHEVDQLSSALEQGLSVLGINTALVVVSGRDSRQSLRLIAGFTQFGEQEKTVIIQKQEDFSSQRLFPEQYESWCSSGAFGVFPLSDEQGFYGYAILSMSISRGLAYEQLRLSLTKALKTLTMMEEIRRARDTARRAEETKNRFLANASKELLEPLFRMSKRPEAGRELDRLIQLAHDLDDLSRAQVDDLVLQPQTVWLPELIAEILPVKWSNPPDQLACVPLVDGDVQRLTKVFQGIGRELADSLKTFGLVGTLRLSTRGVEVVLQVAGSGGLGSQADGSPGIETGISWQLYERIMVLHGGGIDTDTEFPGVQLYLPYPTMSGTGALSSPQRFSFVVGTGEGKEYLHPWVEQLLSLGSHWQAEGAQALPPSEIVTQQQNIQSLAFDISEDSPSLWGMFQRLEHLRTMEHLPLLVVCRDDLVRSQITQSGEPLSALLQRGAEDRRVGPLLIFLGEGQRIDRVIEVADQDAVVLRGRADLHLPDIPRSPRALLLNEDNPDFILEIRQDPRFSTIPLFVVCHGFSRISKDSRLASLPGLCFVHQGVYSPKELANWMVSQPDTAEILPAQTGALVKKAIFYFDEHFSQAISRWMLAEEIHVSEDYLTRIFHRETGLSPWDYLTRFRIAKGAQLLVETGKSVLEIAQRIGFLDQAYFCRVFRRITGQSPTKYRSEARRGA